MKPLTKKKMEKTKFQTEIRDNKQPKLLNTQPKKVAQCCAKSSSIISGCHD
jgi:hypothetical protein